MEPCQGIQLFKPKKGSLPERPEKEKEKHIDSVSSLKEVTCPIRNSSQSFTQLGFSKWLIDTLAVLSITQPTEIQAACIPAIFQGRDILASAKTGSGKTAAFSLPILQRLNEDPFGIYALILTPTRELAYQIGEQVKAFGQAIRVQVAVVVGGIDMMTQALQLKNKPHIVVATPGRLVDLIESSSDSIDLSRIRYLVLDEADRLLESSFEPHLSRIFQSMESNKLRPQTLLFSATLTRELSSVLQGHAREPSLATTSSDLSGTTAKRLKLHEPKLSTFLTLQNPFTHHSHDDFETVNKLDQRFIFIPSQVRESYLIYLLRNNFKDLNSMIIFTGKCKTAELLRIMFKELGIRSTALHSKMNQRDRIGSLAKFKSNIVPILITTDVGSRGLDIPTVQLVLNYDVPADPRDYIHRIGRTARAGRGGLALTIVGEMDVALIHAIEAKTRKKLEEYPVEEGRVLPLLNEVAAAKRVASMSLTDTDFGERQKVYKQKVLDSI